MGLLRAWIRYDGPVDRRVYILSGIILFGFKYLVEAVSLLAVTGTWLTPGAFIRPGILEHGAVFGATAPWLPWAVLIWTLPFIWIGTQLSCRRAKSACGSPWLGILFLAPYVNWLLILLLMVAPEREPAATSDPPRLPMPAGASIALALALAEVVAGAMVAVCVYALRDYGSALFVVTPVLMGVIVGAVMARGGHSLTAAHVTAQGALAIAMLGLVAFALEGSICVLMAWPLAALLVLVGTGIGGMACQTPLAAGQTRRGAGGSMLLLCLLALPLLAWNDARRDAPAIREVVSVVEVDAPAEVVWTHVIAFPDLPEPDGIFATGIACPLRATIDGSGVGAIRRCEFTTGPFIEPITAWEAPKRLAFSVIAQPPTMREFGPYGDVHPPHLDGFLTCLRGEFRLVALPNGRTRLEGSSWYQVDVHPEAYWGWWSDRFVHAIHARVLRHIKWLAESHAAGAATSTR